MKIFVVLLATIVYSISAQLSPELGNALNGGLHNINFSHIPNVNQSSLVKSDHPHAHMNVVQLGEYYGYGAEVHTVITSDGYVLEMHRFTGNKKKLSPKGKQPVFLMHALLCSSINWVLTGPESGLAFILADLGYDVWMGNVRGNVYSQKHNNTSISEADYWDFSFHEIGKYDLPAMIDHILGWTGYKKIIYVGHSQGCASFFTMLSERPEYNDKIMMMFALAPVAYLSHMTSPVFKTLSYLGPIIDSVFHFFGKYKFSPSDEFFEKFSTLICGQDSITQPICTNAIFLICGYSEELLNKELLTAMLAHIPAGASTKQMMHLSQLVRSGYFRQFDDGWWTNIQKYKSFSPPSYKLENVKVPVSVHYSTNDWLAVPEDINKLSSELPNVIGKFRVPHEKFNHLDFAFGLGVKSLLYDKVTSIMKRQEKLNAD